MSFVVFDVVNIYTFKTPMTAVFQSKSNREDFRSHIGRILKTAPAIFLNRKKLILIVGIDTLDGIIFLAAWKF